MRRAPPALLVLAEAGAAIGRIDQVLADKAFDSVENSANVYLENLDKPIHDFGY